MGTGRAYGGRLNMANWLSKDTVYYGVTHRKRCQYLQMHPFIVGTAKIGSWLMMYSVSSH